MLAEAYLYSYYFVYYINKESIDDILNKILKVQNALNKIVYGHRNVVATTEYVYVYSE